jgi:hypothetical protein
MFKLCKQEMQNQQIQPAANTSADFFAAMPSRVAVLSGSLRAVNPGGRLTGTGKRVPLGNKSPVR